MSGLVFAGLEEIKFLVLQCVRYYWSWCVDEAFQVYGFCYCFVPVTLVDH